MKTAHGDIPDSVDRPMPLADRVAWVSLLTGIVALPLVTSVTGGAGSTRSITEEPYHIPKLLVLASVLSVAAIAWIYELIRERRALRGGSVYYGLGAFTLLVCISTVFGLEPLSSLFGVSGLMTGAVTWLLCVVMCVLLGQHVVSSTHVMQATWAAIAGSTGVGAVALLQSVGIDPLSTPFTATSQWMIQRGASTLGNPDYTGLLLVAPTVLAVALSFSADERWARWVSGCSAVVLAGAAFVTLTRAAWLGIAVGVVVLLILSPSEAKGARHRTRWIAAAGLTVVAVGALLAGPNELAARFTSVSRGLDAFSSGRLTMWGDTLRAIAERPLVGTGADRLALGAYEVQSKVVTEGVNRYVIQDSHSLPLLIAGSLGLPALVALATFTIGVLVAGWRLSRSDASRSSARALYGAWVAAAIAFLVAAALSVFTISAVFMLFLTLGVVSAPILRRLETPRWASVLVGVVVLAIVGTALFGSIRGFQASRQMMLSTVSDPQFHLEEAIRLTPWDTRTRVTYQWRKIGAYRQALTGSDITLSHQTADSFDTEIRLQIAQSPYELLWYRMLIDMYRLPAGSPGDRPEKVLEAIDYALERFPEDVEFNEWREAAAAAAESPTNP